MSEHWTNKLARVDRASVFAARADEIREQSGKVREEDEWRGPGTGNGARATANETEPDGVSIGVGSSSARGENLRHLQFERETKATPVCACGRVTKRGPLLRNANEKVNKLARESAASLFSEELKFLARSGQITAATNHSTSSFNQADGPVWRSGQANPLDANQREGSGASRCRRQRKAAVVDSRTRAPGKEGSERADCKTRLVSQ